MPEDYFDSRTTYPGADGVFNYYPVTTAEESATNAVGLGSHTDLQLFTLLWQDMIGGLQVLNKEGQWIKAVPVEGTIVVNIGDFMMRLCNDMYKSTVHRVYNRSGEERVSMPFFFGGCTEVLYGRDSLVNFARSQFQLRRGSSAILQFSDMPTEVRSHIVW